MSQGNAGQPPAEATRPAGCGPALTLPALLVLEVLTAGDGTARYSVEHLAALAGVEDRRARSVLARLAAAGWVAAEPAAVRDADGGRTSQAALGLTHCGLARARDALAAGRAGVARAGRTASPGRPAGPAAVGSRVIGTGAADSQVLRHFLDAPWLARYYWELARLTGMPGGTVRQSLSRMRARGWIENAPVVPLASPRPGRGGRPPRLLVVTAAGLDAAPAALAAARSHLAVAHQALEAAAWDEPGRLPGAPPEGSGPQPHPAPGPQPAARAVHVHGRYPEARLLRQVSGRAAAKAVNRVIRRERGVQRRDTAIRS